MDYKNILSKTVQQIKPSGIRRFFDMACAMKDCISLGVGEPDFLTPTPIRNDAVDVIMHGSTKYTANSGIIELRREVAKYMSERFNVTYNADHEIIITVGGSEGIDLAIRTCVNPGDEVLVPEPCFVCYAPLVEVAGAVPVAIPLREEDGFILTPELLKNYITSKTKLLILAFPNNPTGAYMSSDDYEKIARVLINTNIMVLTDEIYAELNYVDDKPVSFAASNGMRERTIVVNGFSKMFAMTGWRMGFLCAPEQIACQLLKLHQFQIMSAPTISQWAALRALKTCQPEIQNMKLEYNKRRLYLINCFKEMGLPCFEPKGAFYIFPNISKYGLSSEDFCERFLRDYKVAVVPGNAFGNSGEGFVRISYAYSMQHLQKAMKLLSQYLQVLEKENIESGKGLTHEVTSVCKA